MTVSTSCGIYTWEVLCMNKRQARVDDYSKLYQFLSKNYDCGTFFNWDIGRLTFCRYAVNHDMTFQAEENWFLHMKIWENDGEIVAFWHTEEQDQYVIQVSKSYKYLEKEIIDDMLEDAKIRFPEKEKIELTVSSEDEERIQLLTQYSGVKLEFEDEKRRMPLNKESQQYIRNSYHVVNVTQDDAILCEKLAETYRYVWPESSYVPSGKVIFNMLSDLNGEHIAWAVLDEGEQCVAYTMGFIDIVQERVYLYPVAVRQEYLDEGVLELLLETLRNNLIKKNVKYAIINAWYKEQENIIFHKMGVEDWKKELIFEIPLVR